MPSNIVLAFVIFGVCLLTTYLIVKEPHADDLTKTETEDDDPWPDGY